MNRYFYLYRNSFLLSGNAPFAAKPGSPLAKTEGFHPADGCPKKGACKDRFCQVPVVLRQQATLPPMTSGKDACLIDV